MPKPRLLLADDDPDAARLLRTLLETDFDVVSVLHDGLTLVEASARLTPDVIVSDISMPGLDGLSAAALILRRDPSARILFITANGERALAQRCLGIGGCGYVLKHLAGEELIDAVYSALRGQPHLSAAVA